MNSDISNNEITALRDESGKLDSASPEAPLVDSQEFAAATGESIQNTLDLNTWTPGEDLFSLYARLEKEASEAVEQENRILKGIRSEVFPRLNARPGAPSDGGVYQATAAEIERVHNGLLFNGAVEACDSASAIHDTLPLTIVQIGVAAVSYHGEQGSWVHRIFRRDLRMTGTDPIKEAIDLLEQRQRRSEGVAGQRDKVSTLLKRGITAYAERAVLYQKCQSIWRMGRGNPAPYELLTGAGMSELLEAGLDLLENLIARYKRFLFVQADPVDRMLLTIGNALRPLEYAIVDTLKENLAQIVKKGHYRGEWKKLLNRAEEFARDVGSQIIVGLYRASAIAPARMFYAHVEHAHEAALIALADSALQEHRGYPTLIDLADAICGNIFGSGSLNPLAELAYTEAGDSLKRQSEQKIH